MPHTLGVGHFYETFFKLLFDSIKYIVAFIKCISKIC